MILDIFLEILQPTCINEFFLLQPPMLTLYSSQLHMDKMNNARERHHTWSITSHPACSGKRKTVPKRKASGFQKCKRRPQEFCGVVKDKRDASSAVCSRNNAKSFDCKRIIYSLQKCDLLSSFQSCVVGFVDTLILFKAILPQREKYSKESLVSDLFGISYSAHDSLEDVRALLQGSK